ncbi:MAG: polysaccharide deacetylase family protein [Steroidobacteraceae bacterium]
MHCAAAAALAIPGAWPWALGAVVADHLLLTGCGLTPRSAWLGPNWTRLPSAAAAHIAITVDDGPDPEVTLPALDALDRQGAKATFFCIGERVAKYPAVAREIVRRGHAIENHTQHHRHDFSVLGPARLSREIAAAQDTIASVCGTPPAFFRAPAGLRSPWLAPVLSRLGLALVSWTRRGFDTVRRDPEAVLRKLGQGLRAGDILLVHDGSAARTAAGSPVILAVLPRLLTLCGAAALTPITLREAVERAGACGGCGK